MTGRHGTARLVELGLRGHAFMTSGGAYVYPVADRVDLLRAIDARYARRERDAVRRYLARRAHDLGCPEAIPESWRGPHAQPGKPGPTPGSGPMDEIWCSCSCEACRACPNRVRSDDDSDDVDSDDIHDGSSSAGDTGSTGYVGSGDSTGTVSSSEPHELRLTRSPGGLRIDGVVAPTGVPTIIYDASGPYIESLAPGAFDGVLDGDTVLLVNHDSQTAAGTPLARTTSGTLSLRAGPQGLLFSANLDQASPVAQSVISAVGRGDLVGCSFGFCVAEDGDSWSDGMGRRVITKIGRLLDCSLVTYPAYATGTSVQVASARARSRRLDGLRAAEQLRRIKARRPA